MNRFFTATLTLWPELRDVPATGTEGFAAFESRLANVTPKVFDKIMADLSRDFSAIADFTYAEAREVIDNIKPIEFGAVLAQHRQQLTAGDALGS
jgi:hypothetical protein